MKKKILNVKNKNISQGGFSLVELMVSVGILGGMAIFIATLSTTVNKSSVVREADLKVAELMQDFQLKVSKKGVCDYNFEGQQSTIDPLNSVLNLDGSTILAVNQAIDSYFTVSSMKLTKISNTRADLTVVFTRSNSSSHAVSTITRKLKLTVVHEADNTTIKTCLADFDLDVGDTMPLLCNGEGTILSDEGTPADTSDDVCIHAGYSVEQCPVGEFVKRFELVNIDDGSGNLQPYYRPVCDAISLPTSLSCSPNEVLQGYDVDTGLVCRPLVADDIRNYFTGDYNDCQATEQYTISQVGSNININCGAAVPTPTPTETPSPTPTGGTPPGDCVTVNSSTFAAVVRLSSPLDPTIAGRDVKISVTGNNHGTTTTFKCDFYTDGSIWDFYFTDEGGTNWPSASYAKNYDYQQMNMSYVMVHRQSGVIGDCSDCFKCSVVDTLPVSGITPMAICNATDPVTAACGFIVLNPLTTLEGVTPLTICVDDTSSVTQPMYDHSDPFDIY